MRRNEKGGILLFQTRLLIQFLFVSVGLLAIGIAYLTIYLDR